MNYSRYADLTFSRMGKRLWIIYQGGRELGTVVRKSRAAWMACKMSTAEVRGPYKTRLAAAG